MFVRFYRKSSKFDLELSADLKNVIVGLMLGDLHAEKLKPTSNTRLQFKQSTVNKPYIDTLFSMFKEYCSAEPKITTFFTKNTGSKKLYSSIKFWTLSLPCFNQFRELFYNDLGVKIIPEILEELLTPEGLAYWAMDDGYKSGNGFYFCTESFTLEENNKLRKILKNKFNLDCGVHKYSSGHGYRLYVFSSSRAELLKLVKPYLIEHFYYKFDLA